MDHHWCEYGWRIHYGVPAREPYWLKFGPLHGISELCEAVAVASFGKIRSSKSFCNNWPCLNHGGRPGEWINEPVKDQCNRNELRIYERLPGRLRRIPDHYEGL